MILLNRGFDKFRLVRSSLSMTDQKDRIKSSPPGVMSDINRSTFSGEYKSNNKTSTGGTSDYSHLLGFSALSNMLTQIYESFQTQNSSESNFERKSREFLSGQSKYRGPITREVRDKLFGHKIAQKDLRFCSYINYIFGLSALMLDTSVPYEASTTASALLSEEYLSSKLLVQRILLETVTTN